MTAIRRPLPALLVLVLVLVHIAQVARAQPQPRKPAAPPKPLTEEERAAQAIEKTLQRHGPEVHRCFEKALADRIDVSGKVEIQVEVAAGGKVGKSKVVSADGLPPQLSVCVLESAAQWIIEGLDPGDEIVLPFTFAGQMSQFVVKAADAPEHGPAPGKGRGGVKIAPPFMVKILADEANMRAQKAAFTLLTVGPASRVAMHRHPRSAKVLFVVRGHARLLGPPGTPPEKLDEGTAMFLPAGYPHAIENMGRQMDAVFLQAFSPPGPERVYRDPADTAARVDFEVIRDPSKVAVPPGGTPGSRPVVAQLAKAESLPFLNGKVHVRILLDQAVTGVADFGVSVVEFSPATEVPRHSHPGSEEFLYVLSGGGTLTVGSESMPFGPEQTIHVPADQPHAAKFDPTMPTVSVQLYAPGGPEQRFRQAAPPPK